MRRNVFGNIVLSTEDEQRLNAMIDWMSNSVVSSEAFTVDAINEFIKSFKDVRK